MNLFHYVIDALIYICAAAVLAIGGYVVFRYFKGEARKYKRRMNNK